jgi:hypothetical protein
LRGYRKKVGSVKVVFNIKSRPIKPDSDTILKIQRQRNKEKYKNKKGES